MSVWLMVMVAIPLMSVWLMVLVANTEPLGFPLTTSHISSSRYLKLVLVLEDSPGVPGHMHGEQTAL
jgi:hypothetical protein